MKKEDIYVVGIAGGSASGKTTIVEKLKEQFKDEIVMISHDFYYWANDDKTLEERAKLNYDHPKSFETSKLIEDIKILKSGKAVDLPIYDYTMHTRSKETLRAILTKRFSSKLIIEGILILEDPKLRELMDLKVYVDADADERLIRRILRDTKKRGRSLESILTQYQNTVKPMHEEFIEPSKKHADIIIPRGGENTPAIQMLVQHLKTFLDKNEKK